MYSPELCASTVTGLGALTTAALTCAADGLILPGSTAFRTAVRGPMEVLSKPRNPRRFEAIEGLRIGVSDSFVAKKRGRAAGNVCLIAQ